MVLTLCKLIGRKLEPNYLPKNLISQFLEADLGGDRVQSICTRLPLNKLLDIPQFRIILYFFVVDIIIKNMYSYKNMYS